MRAFIAVEIPKEIREKIAEFSSRLKKYGKIKTVEKENIHLTLKFLGLIHESETKKIQQIFDQISVKKYGLKLKGLGTFPTPNYVRVVWTGLSKGQTETQELAKQVGNTDTKSVPHATLARVKHLTDKKNFKDYLEEHKNQEFGEYTVDAVCLFKSELKPEGPEYTKILEKKLD